MGVSARQRAGRRTVTVLDAVSFDVAPGEFVGLRGGRRSGKTTLLRIAAGIERADEGVVTWRGEPVSALRRRERARRLREIGFVPQPQAWRSATGKPMLDHVALPLLIQGCSLGEAMAKAHAVAERVEAEPFLEGLPHELPPEALMRLSLARALVRDPRLLIVDDPSAAASHAEQQALQALLLDLRRESDGMALLVASRETTALHGADRTMSLDGGGRLRVPDPPTARVVWFPGPQEPSR